MTAADICKEYEGLQLKAYRCPAGVLTIGYGHTGEVKPWDEVTEEQAAALLELDLKLARGHVGRLVRSRINDNQREAMTSFVFNLGAGNFKGSTLLRKVNQEPNDLTIRDEFKKWVKGGGEVLPGLVKRRAAEADLYFTPC